MEAIAVQSSRGLPGLPAVGCNWIITTFCPSAVEPGRVVGAGGRRGVVNVCVSGPSSCSSRRRRGKPRGDSGVPVLIAILMDQRRADPVRWLAKPCSSVGVLGGAILPSGNANTDPRAIAVRFVPAVVTTTRPPRRRLGAGPCGSWSDTDLPVRDRACAALYLQGALTRADHSCDWWADDDGDGSGGGFLHQPVQHRGGEMSGRCVCHQPVVAFASTNTQPTTDFASWRIS